MCIWQSCVRSAFLCANDHLHITATGCIVHVIAHRHTNAAVVCVVRGMRYIANVHTSHAYGAPRTIPQAQRLSHSFSAHSNSYSCTFHSCDERRFTERRFMFGFRSSYIGTAIQIKWIIVAIVCMVHGRRETRDCWTPIGGKMPKWRTIKSKWTVWHCQSRWPTTRLKEKSCLYCLCIGGGGGSGWVSVRACGLGCLFVCLWVCVCVQKTYHNAFGWEYDSHRLVFDSMFNRRNEISFGFCSGVL